MREYRSFNKSIISLILILVITITTLLINTGETTASEISNSGVTHDNGVPTDFFQNELELDITVWDHRQDAVHFQAGTNNNGFEQGLVQDTLGNDGFPQASGKSTAIASNQFLGMYGRTLSDWWDDDTQIAASYPGHDGWVQSSLPNAVAAGSIDRYNYVIGNYLQTEFDDWVYDTGFHGWYNFKDGIFTYMNPIGNGSGYEHPTLVGPGYFTYNMFNSSDYFNNLIYPRYLHEIDNMNETGSDDRDATGLYFRYMSYNTIQGSSSILGDDTAFNAAFSAPSYYDNTSVLGVDFTIFTSGTFPNYNTANKDFYSKKEETQDENLVLEPMDGKLTLKYNTTTEVYEYDSDNNSYGTNQITGFFPLNDGDDGVELNDTSYQDVASEFSNGDMTIGLQEYLKIEGTDGSSTWTRWEGDAWTGELYKDDKGNDMNFHFTMKGSGKFTFLGEDETFTFSGDDDFWLFIDEQLVIDLGGAHGGVTCTATFRSDGTIDISDIYDEDGVEKLADATTKDLGLVVGETYDLDFFYAERHTDKSDLALGTNLQYDRFNVDKEGTLNEEGTEVTYKIEVTNEMEDTPMTITKISDWMNTGIAFSSTGDFIDVSAIGLEYSIDGNDPWNPVALNPPGSLSDSFDVLSLYSTDDEGNPAPGIDVDAGETIYFRYTYTVTEDDELAGSLYNKFAVTTKNPASSDAYVGRGDDVIDLTEIELDKKVAQYDEGLSAALNGHEFSDERIALKSGEKAIFSIELKNTSTELDKVVGQEDLIDILTYPDGVTDKKTSFVDSNGSPILFPINIPKDESVTIYFITDENVDTGLYVNVVTLDKESDSAEYIVYDGPTITTKAVETSKYSEGVVTINDTVTYYGLDENETYIVKGVLKDKVTGESCLDAEGEEIVGTAIFVPSEGGSGSVKVTFTFDRYIFKTTTSVVVFQEVYLLSNQNPEDIIASHKDLEDEDQTVEVVILFEIPELGGMGSTRYIVIGLIQMVLASTIFIFRMYRRRKQSR
ncbi:MAG: fibro-slime domain-containing protein [Suipraeoptans sp.]